MGIRYTQVDPEGGKGVRFPDHRLALQHCTGRGIALGESSHNRFSLPDCRNVARATTSTSTRPSRSRWTAATPRSTTGPRRTASPTRRTRSTTSSPATCSSTFPTRSPRCASGTASCATAASSSSSSRCATRTRATATARSRRSRSCSTPTSTTTRTSRTRTRSPGFRGHYHVYTPESVKDLVARTVIGWTLEAEETPDSKVGNGFTLVFRVNKGESLKRVEAERAAEAERIANGVEQVDEWIELGIPDVAGVTA